MKTKKTPKSKPASERRRTVRTPELVAVEELGAAIGRLCAASPEFRADFTAGFTLAMKADALGRVRDVEAAAADFEAKGGAFATTFLDAKLSSAALAYFGAKDDALHQGAPALRQHGRNPRLGRAVRLGPGHLRAAAPRTPWPPGRLDRSGKEIAVAQGSAMRFAESDKPS